MPRYTFKCECEEASCDYLVELDFPISDAPSIGESIEVESMSCKGCNSSTFTRVWPKKTALFTMNFRRTSIL